ncbi:Heat shock cognate 70 kDa protein [Echinococcus granulosus]|uniref:Heat shock protein 70 n=1 Tax=Echinococcus granulosus TaxID=6210 RepID=A0A068WW58_ECHGR|nr:Heat shock cognate 70 kDa protein [Echinococcus granulosus]CDS22722.1 heat shock protein 70 [Echinococcus granulosus]
MSHCGRSSFTDGRIMTWGQPEDRVQNGWKVIREQSPMELLSLQASQLLYIVALRDVDSPELEDEWPKCHFRNTILVSPNCQIHPSFEIEGLDPKYALSTGTAVPGEAAVEMSSGKQNSMIVTTNKGCLLEAEIERMVNDAEKLKQEDEKARSRMAVKNRWMDDDQQATKEKCKLLYKNLETLYSSTMAMRNLGS